MQLGTATFVTVSAGALIAFGTVPAKAAQAATSHSAWRYTVKADTLRGTSSRLACVISTNIVRLKFPYRSQHVRLCIWTPGDGGTPEIDLKLSQGGQFDPSTGVHIKFDDERVEDYGAETGEGGDYSTLFVNYRSNEHMHEIAPDDPAWAAYPSILKTIQSSRRAIVEVGFYDGPLVQLTFDVSGFRP